MKADEIVEVIADTKTHRRQEADYLAAKPVRGGREQSRGWRWIAILSGAIPPR
jgi:hypothetical protein